MIRGERTKFRELLRIFVDINYKICSIVPGLYIGYLRKKGVRIGEGTKFFGSQQIDMTRPCLIDIGKNCVITNKVTLITHGCEFCVLREKYGELVGSSGKIIIGDNVFIGTSSVILRGVSIGKNTIVGAGSIVTQDIPPNSLAAGNPCRVIMTIDQYYEKRKALYIEEAKTYAKELYLTKGKIPQREDFLDEFPLFLDRREKLDLLDKSQLGSSIKKFYESKPIYGSFEEFLIAAGIPESKVRSNKET